MPTLSGRKRVGHNVNCVIHGKNGYRKKNQKERHQMLTAENP